MDYLEKLIIDIELHSVEGIRDCFAHGVNPNANFKNEPLIHELISEYTRTPRFKDCVKVFVDHGLTFDQQELLFVLLDDHVRLKEYLQSNPDTVQRKYSLRCAYTPLEEATLLHVCAEFNHVACAKVLISHGADPDAQAGIDDHGFGGQSPIFHTVNQNNDHSAEMREYLLSLGANLRLSVTGIRWGKGYDWETFIPAVNPVSYAMMGLLPQMHRDERTVSQTVSTLLKAGYGIGYVPQNIPNKYLHK